MGLVSPITASNARTNAAQRDSKHEIPSGDERQPAANLTTDNRTGAESEPSPGSYKATKDDSYIDTDSHGYIANDLQSYTGIAIADDIDDEAIHGRNRHKQRKARTNRR